MKMPGLVGVAPFRLHRVSSHFTCKDTLFLYILTRIG